MSRAILLAFCLLPTTLWAAAKTVATPNPRVEFVTNHGSMVVELWPRVAPKTVNNFLRYVADESYNGSLFHRIVPGFVVQGGGFNPQYQQLPIYEPVINESIGGQPNRRGTIAMARTQAVDSATRQFFFNLVDNDFLNGREGQSGYAVFGEVVSGIEVLDKLAQVPTGFSPVLRADDVPTTAVILKKVTLLPAVAEAPATATPAVKSKS